MALNKFCILSRKTTNVWIQLSTLFVVKKVLALRHLSFTGTFFKKVVRRGDATDPIVTNFQNVFFIFVAYRSQKASSWSRDRICVHQIWERGCTPISNLQNVGLNFFKTCLRRRHSFLVYTHRLSWTRKFYVFLDRYCKFSFKHPSQLSINPPWLCKMW